MVQKTRSGCARVTVVAVEARTARTTRLWTIDALRGAAALGVVLFHGSDLAGISRTRLPERLFDGTVNWGRYGVWLFFVISGFCIHRQWALGARAGQPRRPNFIAFWRRRIRRLYPPYLASLAIYIALKYFVEGWVLTPRTAMDVGLHLVLLHNLDPHAINSINLVFWTLAIEEQLYLLYFVFLPVRIRWGWTAALILGGAARVLWFGLALAVHRLWGSEAILVTQSAAAQWLVWILGAFSVEAALGLVSLPSWLRSGWTAAAILCAAAGISQVYLYTDALTPGVARNLVWLLTDPVWGLGCFVLVNAVVQREGRPPSGAGATLARIGLFSYSLYLSHEIVTNYGWRAFGPAILSLWHAIPNVVITPVLALASISLAWIFFVMFERPFVTRSRVPALASSR